MHDKWAEAKAKIDRPLYPPSHPGWPETPTDIHAAWSDMNQCDEVLCGAVLWWETEGGLENLMRVLGALRLVEKSVAELRAVAEKRLK